MRFSLPLCVLALFRGAESAAASANRTVKPSALPITTSRIDADPVKCFSTCGIVGMIGTA
jgi:hypothetical protein